MNNEIKANPRVANDYKKAPEMNANERTISFFNRFFVYKKMRNVDADKVALDLLHKTVDDEKDEEDLSARAQEAAATVVTKQKVKVKPVKLKGKLKLTL